MAHRIMILAGGTGGHVFPALAVAKALRARGHEVFWMGTQKGLEGRVVPENDIPIEWLSVTGWRGKSIIHRLKAPFMLLLACIQAAKILRRIKPDVVLGVGGFVAGPGGLMAWLLRIPLVIHEGNRIPGTTNRHLARFARIILEAFPGSFDNRFNARWSGNPLRDVFVEPPTDPEPDHTKHGFRLLIVGGSLGAQILNQTVPDAVAKLKQPSIEIRHQTGKVMADETRQRYQQLEVEAAVESFIDDIAAAYRWADLVICRAGAMTISELSAIGVASILVPYPHAIDDHQTHNAQWLADAGGALLIPQPELSVDRLSDALSTLMDSGERAKMARAAHQLARLDATTTVVNSCLEVIQ